MSSTLISAAAGTILAASTYDTRQSACFDGNNAQSSAVCCRSSTNGSGDRFIGKNYGNGNGFQIDHLVFYPSTDNNFDGSSIGSDTSGTAKAYGKTGTTEPASSTDGTLLGTTANFVNASTVTVASTDNLTIYQHVWGVITYPSGTHSYFISEMEMWQFVSDTAPYNPWPQRGPILAQRSQIGWSKLAERWWRRRGRTLWMPEPLGSFSR